MSVWEVCIVAMAGFCSAFIKTGVGIGSGIFLLPILSLAFPAKMALGLGAPIMLASDALAMRFYWRQWTEKKEILRLLAAAVPGLVAGTLLLPVISPHGFRIFVGIFGMAYAISHLFPTLLPVRKFRESLSGINSRIGGNRIYFFGALGGVASVLAHAGGLVWSLYLMTTLHDRRVFVGTVVLIFFITNIYKTAAYIAVGTMAPGALLDILPTIPVVWLGGFIGDQANKHMNQNFFRQLVLAVIFLVSAKLCF